MNDLLKPTVTVIVPTTHDRKEFNDRLHKMFDEQDYFPRTILFDCKEGSVGEKRNRLCDKALGTVILHMDSDDAYSPDWISRSVEALLKNKAQVVGIDHFNLYENKEGYHTFYRYTAAKTHTPQLAGATLCYLKSFWEQHPFMGRNIGEDVLFIQNAPRGTIIHAYDYVEGFLCTIHDNNTSKKLTFGSRYRRIGVEEEIELMKRWHIGDENLGPVLGIQ